VSPKQRLRRLKSRSGSCRSVVDFALFCGRAQHPVKIAAIKVIALAGSAGLDLAVSSGILKGCFLSCTMSIPSWISLKPFKHPATGFGCEQTHMDGIAGIQHGFSSYKRLVSNTAIPNAFNPFARVVEDINGGFDEFC